MKRHKLNQKGLVSIISTVLIIVIITIVTLSLSVFSRRELRQSLDEQLSSQALYAAESGVNDVVNRLTATTNRLTSDISDCSDLSQNNISTNRVLDAENNVRYTCVLVDQSPPQINTNVTTSQPKLYLLDPGASDTIKSLKFVWKDSNTSGSSVGACTTTGCFTPSTAWGSTNRLGALRVRLFPAGTGGTLTSTTFTDDNAIDIIGFPGSRTGFSDTMNASDKSRTLYATCISAESICTVNVDNLSALNKTYYMQLSSMYKDINVTLTGTNSVSNAQTQFIGAQVSIDSTGAAGDVFKRLSVTIPLGESSNLPIYTLGVGDKLCKRFETSSTATDNTNSDDTASKCPAF